MSDLTNMANAARDALRQFAAISAFAEAVIKADSLATNIPNLEAQHATAAKRLTMIEGAMKEAEEELAAIRASVAKERKAGADIIAGAKTEGAAIITAARNDALAQADKVAKEKAAAIAKLDTAIEEKTKALADFTATLAVLEKKIEDAEATLDSIRAKVAGI